MQGWAKSRAGDHHLCWWSINISSCTVVARMWQRQASRAMHQVFQAVSHSVKGQHKALPAMARAAMAQASKNASNTSHLFSSSTYQSWRSAAAVHGGSFSFAASGLNQMPKAPCHAPMSTSSSSSQVASRSGITASSEEDSSCTSASSALSPASEELDDDEPGTNFCRAGIGGPALSARRPQQRILMTPLVHGLLTPRPSGQIMRLISTSTAPANQQGRPGFQQGSDSKARQGQGYRARDNRPQGREGRDDRAAFRGRDRSSSAKLEDDLLELKVATKDAFMQKSLPLAPGLREVLYAHQWDKLLVDVRRSVNLVKDKGKVEQYSAMVAVGNMKGLFGLGIGDGPTAQEAVAAAHLRAFSSLQVVPLYRSHTIFHPITHHYHWLKMCISPRPSGSGVVASDLLTELCSLAGIKDVHIKVHARRRSRFFVATAFQEALQKQTVPHDGVEGSGVYLQEVYAGDSKEVALS